MKCPLCLKDDPAGHEMCPFCGAPIKPIPIPPGGKVRFGRYDWFVLDKKDNKKLILTEKVIEKRPYHNQECDVTWETSDIRKYLNGDFYNSFSESEKARIIKTNVITKDNPWYGTSGGNPTVDWIFLLSIEEVVKYFGDSGQLSTRYMYPNCDWCKDEYLPWIDDQYNVNRRAVDEMGIVCFWRLRSSGGNARSTACVTGFSGDGFDQGGIGIGNADMLIDGHFLQTGYGNLSQIEDIKTMNGIRPALWVYD